MMKKKIRTKENKNKNKLKWIGLVLTFSIALTGCVESRTLSDSYVDPQTLEDIIPNEIVTLEVYDQEGTLSGMQTGWFAQLMEEKFHVQLEFITDDEYIFETRLENGNLGDIILFSSYSTDYLTAVAAGALLDFNEDDILTKFGSELETNLQDSLEKNENLTDGTLYGIGTGIVSENDIKKDTAISWDLRFDLYQELGEPQISGLSDLNQVLLDMKELEPYTEEGLPMYATSIFDDWDQNLSFFPSLLVQAYYGYDVFGFGFYDPENGEYMDALTEDSIYIEALNFYNDLYLEGLIDPLLTITGYEGASSEFEEGLNYFSLLGGFGSELFNTEENLAEEKAMYPVIPTEASVKRDLYSVYGEDAVYSIGDRSNYPELAMAILNWMATPEGMMTCLYGPEGTNWILNDDGSYELTEFGKSCLEDPDTNMPAPYTGTYAEGEPAFSNTIWSEVSPMVVEEAQNETMENSTYEAIAEEALAESVTETSESPIYEQYLLYSDGLDPDQYIDSKSYLPCVTSQYQIEMFTDEMIIIWNEVANEVTSESWNAIFADSKEEFDSIVKNMLDKVDAYGYNTCYDFMKNEASKRYEKEQEFYSQYE